MSFRRKRRRRSGDYDNGRSHTGKGEISRRITGARPAVDAGISAPRNSPEKIQDRVARAAEPRRNCSDRWRDVEVEIAGPRPGVGEDYRPGRFARLVRPVLQRDDWLTQRESLRLGAEERRPRILLMDLGLCYDLDCKPELENGPTHTFRFSWARGRFPAGKRSTGTKGTLRECPDERPARRGLAAIAQSAGGARRVPLSGAATFGRGSGRGDAATVAIHVGESFETRILPFSFVGRNGIPSHL